MFGTKTSPTGTATLTLRADKAMSKLVNVVAMEFHLIMHQTYIYILFEHIMYGSQVHELSQSRCGDHREGTLFS